MNGSKDFEKQVTVLDMFGTAVAPIPKKSTHRSLRPLSVAWRKITHFRSELRGCNHAKHSTKNFSSHTVISCFEQS